MSDIEQEDLNKRQGSEYKYKYTRPGTKGPLERAWCCLKLFYCWVNPILSIAKKITFQQDMHYNHCSKDMISNQIVEFKNNWDFYYKKNKEEILISEFNLKKPSIIYKVLWKTYKLKLIACLFLSLIFSLCQYISPFIIYHSLEILKKRDDSPDKEIDYWVIGELLGALVISRIVLTVLNTQLSYQQQVIGIHIRNALCAIIMKKVLKKSVARELEFTTGEMVNLCSSDTQKFSGIGQQGIGLIVAPFSIIIGIAYQSYIAGPAVFPALFCVVIVLAVNYNSRKGFSKISKGIMVKKDERMKAINECFENIRFVKMTAIENYFLDKICRIKEVELDLTSKNFMRVTMLSSFNRLSPVAFIICYFGFFIQFEKKHLELKLIFTSLQVFTTLYGQMTNLPSIASYLLDTFVSGQRITNFLISDEVDKKSIHWVQPGNQENDDLKTPEQQVIDMSDIAVEMRNCNLYWVEPRKVEYMEKKKIQEEQKRAKKCCSKKTPVINSEKNNKKVNPSMITKLDENTLTEPLMSEKKDETMTISDNEEAECPDPTKQKLDQKNINMTIPKGACVALIGKVGSGKSSILQALFGELYSQDSRCRPNTGLDCTNTTEGNESLVLQKPEIYINGSTSYVDQKTWLQSSTIKTNIQFHSPYDEERYKDAIYYSDMEKDMETMSDGDNTMLGDKGVNLSGGQKVRLSIARAIYANKDIVLQDDPISALDIHVAQFIMEECIMKYLKGKTRIVATHAIGFLKYFDYIYIINEGSIIQQGKYDYIKDTQEYIDIATVLEEKELTKQRSGVMVRALTRMESKLSAFSVDSSIFLDRGINDPQGRVPLFKRSITRYFDDLEKIEELEINEAKDMADETLEIKPVEEQVDEVLKKQEKLVENIISSEDRAKGGVSWEVINTYVKLSGGFGVFGIIFILMSLYICCKGGNTWFLQWWGSQSEDKQDIEEFLFVYSGVAILQNIFVTSRSYFNFNRGIHLSKKLNFYMCHRLLHSSIAQFWDRVPLGRVLNRFSRDQQIVDREMPVAVNTFAATIFTVLLDFIMCTIGSSMILWVFIFGYFYLCILLQRYYMHAMRELTRLQAISQTPVTQIFTETLSGVLSLRIFGKQKNITNDYYNAIDGFYANQIMLIGVQMWFSIRINMLSILIIVPGFFFAIYFGNSAGMVAQMLSYMLSITDDIGSLMMNVSNTENRFISFERCHYFMQLDTEPGYKDLNVVESNFFNKKPIIGGKKAKEEDIWMKKGHIEFKNYSCKYRKDLGFVLKKISINIKPGRKVGIVGRTGSGKSTFLNSIFKSFEYFEGEILIDGKNIDNIDLKKLRNNMTVIPQDPQLFDDTLEKNLDPNQNFDKETIIDVLKQFEIWDKFLEKGGLEFKIQGGGQNLSQGEKQLLCMARALLNKNKLILLDEATANIDVQTESLIQKAVEKNFRNSTILMIAHRLNTIMFCDRVLVLDKGRIIEYNKMSKLKNDPNTFFGAMLQSSKDVHDALG